MCNAAEHSYSNIPTVELYMNYIYLLCDYLLRVGVQCEVDPSMRSVKNKFQDWSCC